MKSEPHKTYKYELYDGNELVYVGITIDLKRREQDHKRDHKIFTKMVKVGRATTKEAAHKWEGERLATYRKNHGGELPKYSRSALGDSL